FVLFVVSAFAVFTGWRGENLAAWAIFAAAVAAVALPELAWMMSGSATKAGSFFGWKFGWDKGEANFFWFWLKNTGAFIPLLALGFYLIYRDAMREPAADDAPVKKGKKAKP